MFNAPAFSTEKPSVDKVAPTFSMETPSVDKVQHGTLSLIGGFRIWTGHDIRMDTFRKSIGSLLSIIIENKQLFIHYVIKIVLGVIGCPYNRPTP